MSGVTVQFGFDLDSGCWPSLPRDRDVVVGHRVVGPAGLVSLLETHLGLGGPTLPDEVRAAQLVGPVLSTEGFWSESATADPIGVAAELLRWRDELQAHGWAGEGVAPRLAALAVVTHDASPGLTDRLRACTDEIAKRNGGSGIGRLELLREDAEEAPPIWRALLQTLAATGVVIETIDLPTADARAGSDLAAARGGTLSPRGDGSLQLVRPGGPVAAADQVAAWLATRADATQTVVVGSDALLDTMLSRHGFPVTGARTATGDAGLLALLPLVIELAWSPQDPVVAHELISQQHSPIPSGVAWRLDRALHEWPAVDSDDWRRALDDGLGAIDDEPRRATVRARLDAILRPSTDGSTVPATSLVARAEVLRRWAAGRRESDPAGGWDALLRQLADFDRLLEAIALDDLDRTQVGWVVRTATRLATRAPRHDAEAGVAAVGRPGALCGPAPSIVWWDFTRTAVSPSHQLPLRHGELEALATIGVTLPTPAERAERLARRWRRPLEQATTTLLLVAPHLDARGRPVEVHPLWDEITASVDRAETHLISRALPLELPLEVAPAPLIPPAPTRTWRVPSGVVLDRFDGPYSPNAAGKLIECPFHWLVTYCGKLWPGRTALLSADNLLKGSLAHHVFEEVLPDDPSEADLEELVEAAGRVFDVEGPRLAASLFAPGREPIRDRTRRHILDAVRDLAQTLGQAGVVIAGREVELERQIDDLTVSGRADLLLGQAPGVLDIKWGSASRHRTALTSGTAFQLAVYGRLVGTDEGVAPSAYYVVTTRTLLTTSATSLARGTLDGPTPRDTWAAFRQALDARRAELRDGVAHSCARAAGEAMPTSAIEDGRLRLEPGCRFCQHLHLCGGRRD